MRKKGLLIGLLVSFFVVLTTYSAIERILRSATAVVSLLI